MTEQPRVPASPLFLQDRELECVDIDRRPYVIVFKGNELAKQAFLPHTQAHAEALRGKIVSLDISIDAPDSARLEEVIDRRSRSLQGKALASEIGVHLPSDRECVWRLKVASHLPDSATALAMLDRKDVVRGRTPDRLGTGRRKVCEFHREETTRARMAQISEEILRVAFPETS